MRWSVSLLAEGDRVLELAEIVELADAVAPLNGIASGMGTATYGAQILVDAPSADEAVELAVPLFVQAAAHAGLPDWPVTRAEVVGEDDDLDDLGDLDEL
jgi:hypothetical protein